MTELRRSLGLPGLTLYGVGIIVGAGVYSVIGAAAGLVGDALWLSFVLAAAVALLTGLSYAELAAAYPQAGAEYTYLGRAFPKREWVAFVVGFLVVVAGTATAATVALAFGGYLSVLLPVPSILAAAGLLVVATAVNVTGIKEASWVNVLFTGVEVAGLVLVILIGVSIPGFGAALASAPSAGLWTATALIFFVYLGFEELANLAEEARQPERDIPRAILLSLVLTTGLYVLVALAVVAMVPAAELAGSDSPLATAIAAVSPDLVGVMGTIGLFATANTVLIIVIGTSRTVLAMARRGGLPPVLARVARRQKTPWVAAVGVGLGAALFLPLGGIEVVASMASLGSLVAFGAVNVALVVLRIRDPSRRRPFRVPITIGRIPVLPLAGVLVIGFLLLQFSVTAYAAVGLALAVALVLHRSRGIWARPDGAT